MKMKLISRLAVALLAAAIANTAGASDLERETRIKNQIVDAIFDGEPLDLEADGHEFLAVYMESGAEEVRGAALILHGRGLNPEWENVVLPLRVGLAEAGWNAMSIQLPVLEKEAKYFDYLEVFPEAVPRIEAAIAYLREQGNERIVLIAHSCGAHMAMHWVEALGAKHANEQVAAYVGIGMGATDYKQPMPHPFPLAGLSVPLLDIYAENDYPAVLRMAPERAAMLEKGGNAHSAQQVIPGADHYFGGYNEPLVDAVIDWLNGL